MKAETFTGMAANLRHLNELYVAGIGTSREANILEDAAQWLDMLAPLMPMLAPLLGGEIRRRIERTEVDRLEAEVARLTRLVGLLAHPAGPTLAARVDADRVLREAGHA